MNRKWLPIAKPSMHDYPKEDRDMMKKRTLAKGINSFRKSLSDLPNNGLTNSTYQSTAHMMMSPTLQKSTSALNLEGSPRKDEIKAMLSKANSSDLFSTERHPRPKAFFHQAYLAKSKMDTVSNISKMNKSKSIGKMGRAYYPPGHPKTQNLSQLPYLKPKRFNEDTMSEYSTMSKRMKQPRKLQPINQGQKYAMQNMQQSKVHKVDGSHLSHVSDRQEELKRMLIDTIEHMNDKEVEIMKSAIDSVKGSPPKPKVSVPKKSLNSSVFIEER